MQGLDVPLFPVNLGGLGFLTAITTDEIYPELERALRGEHRIGRRRMLACELSRGGEVVARYEALNDVVITKSAMARMIDLDTMIDSQFLCAYKADGLIVSTPTGSTAYSLSAGGPIVFPSVAAVAITPICPHMLTNRPVLVPNTSVIQITCRAADSAFLTVDGQVGEPLFFEDRVICRSSSHCLSLIRPPKAMFFDVLRQKLGWGQR
jgi:NAD+ kinase